MADMGTVGELLDYLATQPRDRKVILRKDAEGNGHSPLADAWEAMYAAGSTWSGDTYATPEDLAGTAPGEYSPGPDDAERVVVLGPVN